MVDDRDDYGEERWLSIGWVSTVLLVVAHTERGIHSEVIRIISKTRVRVHFTENPENPKTGTEEVKPCLLPWHP